MLHSAVGEQNHAPSEANSDCCGGSNRQGAIEDAAVPAQFSFRSNNGESGNYFTSRSVFQVGVWDGTRLLLNASYTRERNPSSKMA